MTLADAGNNRLSAASRLVRYGVGWMVGPGFGPVDQEVAATVKAAADALEDQGVFVEHVGIPALERDFALDVLNKLHVMELKPGFAAATVGRSQDELYKMAKTMLSLPDTSMKDFIEAEQAAERLRDGYADYFTRYNALTTHVLPTAAEQGPSRCANRMRQYTARSVNRRDDSRRSEGVCDKRNANAL